MLQMIDLDLQPRFTGLDFHSSASGGETGSQARATRDNFVSGSSMSQYPILTSCKREESKSAAMFVSVTKL
jgi:hypothetical protein